MRFVRYILLCLVLCFAMQGVQAQDEIPKPRPHRSARSIAKDTTAVIAHVDSIPVLTREDSASLVKMQKKVAKHKRDWTTWKPDAKKAMWLALVIPGAGQIYNRKFWKLPIIYGGFIGCAYAMRWNNQMYHDYSQAYNDLIDNDPNTHSYDQFMHLGVVITDANKSRYESLFKSRKDTYRRWRDLSFFIMLGVYALSVIDAYVDASLSKFDISNDISLRLQPAIINNKMQGVPNCSSPGEALIYQNSLGVRGTLTF